ncbi:putative ABC transport system permease protein [Microbacterium sp. SORGH_AS 1204]|uniref:ABC transporter permease n=1 Tax=Microbacterium sp. SORGH_AS_1204 TaxID=3041785 RepID=UPI00278F23D9|nr:ABC transporter permease [Microbacterium sp. SORGH_AS_1204]MDQ1138181.1 putative ABC transport system permease protein [Microbacterium sp. SORGH_AS_1204]
MSVSALLRRKLRRDLRRHAPQFAAVFVVSLLCLAVYGGLEGGWRGMQVEQERMDAAAHLADVWITASSVSPEQLDALRDIPGVSDVEASGLVDAAEEDGRGSLVVSALPERMNLPEPVAGVVDGLADDEIALDAAFAEAHALHTGDIVSLQIAGEERRFTVASLVRAADRVSDNGPDGLYAPDPSAYGYAYVSPAQMDSLRPTRMSIALAGPTERILSEAPRVLGAARLAMFDEESLPGVVGLTDRIHQIRSLSVLFLSLFLTVAMLAMFTSMRRLVDIQQRDIATLKVLGVSDAHLRRHYSRYAVVVAVGALVGSVVAPVLSLFVLQSQRPSFELVAWVPAYTPAPAVLAIALVVGASLVSVVATRSMRYTEPAAAMRGGLATQRRVPPRFGRKSPLNAWGLRELATARARLLTALAATVGGTTLLIAGFGMPDSLHHQVDRSFKQQYVFDAQARLIPGAWARDGEHLASGIEEVQWQMSFLSPDEADTGWAAVTVLSDGDLYRLSDGDGGVPLPTDGALVSVAYAEARGISVGDRVTVLPPGSATRIATTVRRIVDVGEPQGLFLSQSAWERSGGVFSPSTLLAGGPAAAETLMSRPGIASVLSRDARRANAEQVIDGLGDVFALIKGFGLMLTIVVLLNLGSLAFAERTRDYATLIVLGVRSREIRALLLRENVATTLAGALLGIPAGMGFLSAYLAVFSTDRVGYSPAPSAIATGLCVVIVVACGLSASLLLARRLRRLDMLGALKGVE